MKYFVIETQTGETAAATVTMFADRTLAEARYHEILMYAAQSKVPKHGERLAEFARFMLHFSEKNILFAHLYECDRKEKDMWREEHAALLAETVSQIDPDTHTLIPRPGEIYELS